MDGYRYITLLVERLKCINPQKIILFGSYAIGNETNESDLDIMVVTNDEYIPDNFTEKSKMYVKVSKTISEIKKEFPVDLIVHTKAMHKRFIDTDSMFAREILTKGKVLYESNS